MFNDNNAKFVVAESATFLYFDLRYRGEVAVWTTRNLSSVTDRVQEIFLFIESLDRQGRAKCLL